MNRDEPHEADFREPWTFHRAWNAWNKRHPKPQCETVSLPNTDDLTLEQLEKLIMATQQQLIDAINANAADAAAVVLSSQKAHDENAALHALINAYIAKVKAIPNAFPQPELDALFAAVNSADTATKQATAMADDLTADATADAANVQQETTNLGPQS